MCWMRNLKSVHVDQSASQPEPSISTHAPTRFLLQTITAWNVVQTLPLATVPYHNYLLLCMCGVVWCGVSRPGTIFIPFRTKRRRKRLSQIERLVKVGSKSNVHAPSVCYSARRWHLSPLKIAPSTQQCERLQGRIPTQSNPPCQ